MPTDEAGLSRAEVWRLVDDSNNRWMDAHKRQTEAIDRMNNTMANLLARLERHENDDDAVHVTVHDLKMDFDRAQTWTGRKLLFVVAVCSSGFTWLLNHFYPAR